MGHYTGLLQLGKDAMNAQHLPVYATARVYVFLHANEPWATLVRDGYIDLTEIVCDTPYIIVDGAITVHSVLHRGEYSDTVAYSLRGEQQRLVYCPDIDRWQAWQHNVRDVVAAHAISLVDGSFFADGELVRDMSLIPHPLVTDTVECLHGLQDKALFIHLNHTNPLLEEGSAQRRWLRERGFDVGVAGMEWVL